MNAYLCAVADSTVLAYAATEARARCIAALITSQPVMRLDRVVSLDSTSDNEAVFWPW